MKQKSILWSMLAIMMVAMLSVGFSACSKDDDSGVVGTWSGRDGTYQITFTFSKNGSGTYISRNDDSSSKKGTEAGPFTYTIEASSKGSKGMIIINDDGDTEILYFVIEGKTMSVYEGYYYDDFEFMLTKQ